MKRWKQVWVGIAAAILGLAVCGGAIVVGLGSGAAPANPPVVAEPPWDSPQTRALFFRACGDCHSNETAWPWYSRLPLISDLVVRDVLQGRRELNVSEWGQRENETEDVVEVIRNGHKFPAYRLYLIAHPQARLSPAEQETLIQGLIRTFGTGGEHEGSSEHESEHEEGEED